VTRGFLYDPAPDKVSLGKIRRTIGISFIPEKLIPDGRPKRHLNLKRRTGLPVG
jgi:hypothetical protein